MENRKNQFLGFILILLIIGFLQYFRRMLSGYMLSKAGKILYLSTMITFTIGVMYVLYATEVKTIFAFSIGLFVTTMSEHLAKLIIIVGDNFNSIMAKLAKKYLKIDINDELKSNKNKIK